MRCRFTGDDPKRIAPCEDHEIVDQGADSVGLPDDQRGGLLRLPVGSAQREQLAGSADSAERVLHLVGDSRGNAAERCEALPLRDDVGELLVERAVAEHQRGAVGLPACGEERRRRHLDHERWPEALLHRALALEGRTAATEGLAREPRQRVVRPEEPLDGPSGRRLPREPEDPARLCADLFDPAGGVDHHDTVGQRIEQVREIARRHGVLGGCAQVSASIPPPPVAGSRRVQIGSPRSSRTPRIGIPAHSGRWPSS